MWVARVVGLTTHYMYTNSAKHDITNLVCDCVMCQWTMLMFVKETFDSIFTDIVTDM